MGTGKRQRASQGRHRREQVPFSSSSLADSLAHPLWKIIAAGLGGGGGGA